MIDEILSIEEVGTRDLIDIEVTGNHLFYANNILTHNSNTDVGLEDTSESFGLPATADFMFALISTEELESLGQIMVKQLKNRYNDPGTHKRFVIGVDRAKMKLYDVEESAQSLIQSTPTTGGGSAEIANNTFGNNTRDFSGFKA
jgi:hypothetical protein